MQAHKEFAKLNLVYTDLYSLAKALISTQKQAEANAFITNLKTDLDKYNKIENLSVENYCLFINILLQDIKSRRDKLVAGVRNTVEHVTLHSLHTTQCIKKIEEYLNQYNFAEYLKPTIKNKFVKQAEWLQSENVKMELQIACKKIHEVISKAKIRCNAYIVHGLGKDSSYYSDFEWVEDLFLGKMLYPDLKAMGFAVTLYSEQSHKFPISTMNVNCGSISVGDSRIEFIPKMMSNSKVIIVVGTPALYCTSSEVKQVDHFLYDEITELNKRMREEKHGIYPILISGTEHSSFPVSIIRKQIKHAHWIPDDKDAYSYINNLSQLSQDLFKISANILTMDEDKNKSEQNIQECERQIENIWNEFKKKVGIPVANDRNKDPKSDTPVASAVDTSRTRSNSTELYKLVSQQTSLLNEIKEMSKQTLTATQESEKSVIRKIEETETSINQNIDEKTNAMLKRLDEIDHVMQRCIVKYKQIKNIPEIKPDMMLGTDKLTPQDKFYQQFNQLLCDFLNIANLVDAKLINPDQSTCENVKTVLETIGDLIPLPWVGFVAKLLTRVIIKVDQSSKIADAEQTTKVLGTDNNLVEQLAKQITTNYSEQIEQMSDKGIKSFAEACRKRLISSIAKVKEKEFKNYENISADQKIDFLILGIINGKSSNFKNNRIENVVSKNWTDSGIFRRSGLRDSQGVMYVCHKTSNNAKDLEQNKSAAIRKAKEKYGYHLATAAEITYFKQAKEYVLTPTPPEVDRSKRKPMLARAGS